MAVAVQAGGTARRLAGPLAGSGETALLAGDLNAATWSAAVRRIEAACGLTHVAGIGPSWLDRRLPDALRPYVGLPIDQVFAKGDIVILSAKTLEAVGSDHLPVLVEFSLLGGASRRKMTMTATASGSGVVGCATPVSARPTAMLPTHFPLPSRLTRPSTLPPSACSTSSKAICRASYLA